MGADPIIDGKRHITFGGSCYRIPVWNAQRIQPKPLWPFRRTIGSTQSMTVLFANQEVAREVQGYQIPRTVAGKPIDGIGVNLTLFGIEDKKQYDENSKRAHIDIWYAEGAYASRSVEPISDTGLFRVYRTPGSNSWMIVTKRPDPEHRNTHLAPGFYVGSCHVSEGTREHACVISVDQSALHFNFHTLEENVPVREQIALHALSKLESWKVACAG